MKDPEDPIDSMIQNKQTDPMIQNDLGDPLTHMIQTDLYMQNHPKNPNDQCWMRKATWHGQAKSMGKPKLWASQTK